MVFRYCSDILFGAPFIREVENSGILQTGDERLSILAWHAEHVAIGGLAAKQLKVPAKEQIGSVPNTPCVVADRPG